MFLLEQAIAPRFLAPAPGDVLDDGDEALGRPGAVPHEGDRDLHPNRGTIFAEIPLFQRIIVDLAGLQSLEGYAVGFEVRGVLDVLKPESHELVVWVADDVTQALV